MKYNIFSLMLIFLCDPNYLSATIFEVGPGQSFQSPNALYLAEVLNDGDTIYIDRAEYIGVEALAVWPNHNLLIKGVGGRPHLIANGEYIWGKGIWVLVGNNITVENIEFSGAAVPDQNGAGIRLDGIGLTVLHCSFHDNENGILTSNPEEGEIIIRYSEFGSNGAGDGFSHNLYIGRVASLTFEFNYSHHAKIGHCLKSRAHTNLISYNRIMDEETGTSSRLIDISNGGLSLIIGNLLMQGPNAENNNLIGFGLEGTYGNDRIYLTNNTMINRRAASCLFLSLSNQTIEALAVNNIFGGLGTFASGSINENHNMFEADIDQLFFEDEQNYNYQLTANSPVIDQGVSLLPLGQYGLNPSWSYAHPTSGVERLILDTNMDIGAFEHALSVSSKNVEDDDFLIYPNPAFGQLYISNISGIHKYQILSAHGKILLNGKTNGPVVDISSVASGFYFLRIEWKGQSTLKRFVKF